MASKAKKQRGDHKDSAVKNTFNPPNGGGPDYQGQTNEPNEQDPKRRIGQHSETGTAPLMKK